MLQNNTTEQIVENYSFSSDICDKQNMIAECVFKKYLKGSKCTDKKLQEKTLQLQQLIGNIHNKISKKNKNKKYISKSTLKMYIDFVCDLQESVQSVQGNDISTSVITNAIHCLSHSEMSLYNVRLHKKIHKVFFPFETFLAAQLDIGQNSKESDYNHVVNVNTEPKFQSNFNSVKCVLNIRKMIQKLTKYKQKLQCLCVLENKKETNEKIIKIEKLILRLKKQIQTVKCNNF